MTLDSFVAETACDLGRFWSDWKAKQGTAEGGMYPMDLQSGDWLEQFLVFISLEKSASPSPAKESEKV